MTLSDPAKYLMTRSIAQSYLLQELTERFCKSVLLYNLAADKLSKTEYHP